MMKPLSVRWIISAYYYLRTEAGIMCGGFVEAGIFETMDEAKSDCDSEVTLLPISMSSRYLTYTTSVHSTT